MSTSLANIKGALNPLKAADVGDVLTRVLNEESTKDIAASYGVTRSALNQWLLTNAEQDWRTVQIIRAHKRKDEAEEEMETAPDSLSLARAREKLKAAQWDLERICRRIYGQEAAQDGVGRISITLNIGDRTAQSATYPQGEAEVVDV